MEPEGPTQLRHLAFNEQMLPPGAEMPPRKIYPDADIERDAMLYQGAIEHTGFSARDLSAISQPVLAVHGGASHPRFAACAHRLAQVLPNVELLNFATCSHLKSPQRNQPVGLREALLALWSQ